MGGSRSGGLSVPLSATPTPNPGGEVVAAIGGGGGGGSIARPRIDF